MAELPAGERFRFAFDIGGTFTDCVLIGDRGSVITTKVLSDHQQVVRPIVAGLEQMLEGHGLSKTQVEEVVVGATTAVTNLVIERKGALTGLITTAGFRDVIEIGRELRYDLYDLTAPGPDPVIARPLRAEINERTEASGRVAVAADRANIEQVVRELTARGVESIAVCLLHSFTNPAHEQMVRDVIHSIAPSVPVSLSSEVLGELREYERTVATVLNAYVMPMVGHYLGVIESGLRAAGIAAVLRIMQSNGGVISRELGERMPIRMLESGPAAGALGAAHCARSAAIDEVLAFDMGGTTAKACLIRSGRPAVTTDFEAARLQRFKKGSGLPVRPPTVDLIEIGAGGGSIAHIDETGLMKVGPHSAGSSPGPACYGLGGELPTVTDAALLMGYLDAGGSLSGAVRLRADRAEQAIGTHLAKPLGLSVIEAANGIHRIVCEHMAAAAKIHAVENGRDVRACTLLAFGGAGPIHAREVARRAGCRNILVPANAGVFSAFGLLVAPIRMDSVRTRFTRLDGIDWAAIESLFTEMEAGLQAQLVASGIDRAAIEFTRSADIRYVGQGFEVETAIPPALDESARPAIVEAFQSAYASRFGRHLEKQSIEVVNWRVEASVAVAAGVTGTDAESAVAPTVAGRPSTMGSGAGGAVSPSGAAPQAATSSDTAPSTRRRLAYFPDVGDFVDTPVIRESELVPGQWLAGPALIEQPGSTVVIGPGDGFGIDAAGNIRVVLGGARAR
jgi:N-methylhydantoinase A/oxoprolinase/acetone carboxylase beta subunit